MYKWGNKYYKIYNILNRIESYYSQLLRKSGVEGGVNIPEMSTLGVLGVTVISDKIDEPPDDDLDKGLGLCIIFGSLGIIFKNLLFNHEIKF